MLSRAAAALSPVARKVIAIGHRGAKAIARDNTLDSFHKALAHGVDMIEFDINLTRDDVLVVYHDNHMPDGRNVREISHTEFKAYASDLITLETMLTDEALVNSHLQLYFDLKDPAVTGPLMSYLTHLVNTHVWHPSRIWIASFDLDQARAVRALRDADAALREVTVGGIFEELVAENPAQVYHDMGLEFVSVHYSLLNEANIASFHEHGQKVFSWTVNSEEECTRLVQCGIDGLCGDKPDLLMKHRVVE
jgi:glycerophosphoryl diester phosphodiesterase